jgi:ABC-type uncharacterized transport system substrate-binding protein
VRGFAMKFLMNTERPSTNITGLSNAIIYSD